MKNYKNILMAVLVGLCMLTFLSGCEEEKKSNKSVQAQRAKAAANSINFADNTEIDNIKKRLEMTSHPDAMGYILLMNEMGQPVMYTTVKGKITSGNKRLTEPDRSDSWGSGANNVVRQAPSDEGTYGSSDSYIFFWTTSGQYIQWNGKYLFSDKPFRTSIEPLVLEIAKK